MITVIVVIGALVLYAPIHAYGMGRYQKAAVDRKPPFDPNTVIHDEYCNMHPRWRPLDRMGCNRRCVEHAKRMYEVGGALTALCWPVVWPLGAAMRAGRNGSKPVATKLPDDVQRAFEELEKQLGEK